MTGSYEAEIAKQIISRGEELDADIYEYHEEKSKHFNKFNYFALAVVHSLIWSGHAIEKNDYYENALDILEKGKHLKEDQLRRFSGRYGPESLGNVLKSWKKVFDMFGMPDKSLASIDSIVKLQQELFKKITLVKRNGAVFTGMGAWVFCAPFKIILIHKTNLINDEKADDLWMPLGLEVNRGIKKLIEMNVSWVQGIDRHMVTDEEGNLEEGMGTVFLAQEACRKISTKYKSKIVHINTGLHCFGAGDI